jgi:hypothetical protein
MDMESDLNNQVTITLSTAACLVLFELLTVSYEAWRGKDNNPNDAAADAMLVNVEEASQRAALWELEGSIERTLPELFSSNYGDLLAESRRLLQARIGE